MSFSGAGKKFMDVVTYTGNGGTQSIGGLDFSPDLVWIKERDGTRSHALCDSVRGDGLLLYTNDTAAEQDIGSSVVELTSDGFNLGFNGAFTSVSHNFNVVDHVAWCWNAGDTTQEIAAGSVLPDFLDSQVYSSLVSVNTGGYAADSGVDKGFDGFITSATGLTYCQSDTSSDSIISIDLSSLNINTATTDVVIYNLGNDAALNNNASRYQEFVGTLGTTQLGRSTTGITCPNDIGILQTINIRSNVSLQGFSGITVGGSVLVDTGVTPPGLNSIASTVRANQDAGFSVVSWTGTGINSNIGHGLTTSPSMVIVKRRDGVNNWRVGHVGLTDWSYYINLESTGAEGQQVNIWNSTAPTDSVFSIGTSSSVNVTSGTYIAYCWSEVPGYSKFGNYYGNSGTNFQYTGFKPKWLMIKRSDDGSNAEWKIFDAVRDTNPHQLTLRPNVAAVEETNAGEEVTFTSNGIILNGNNNSSNTSGGQYIFMAFAEMPIKPAQKKRLTFSTSQDFDEILTDDVLTQYPNATASGTVASKDKEAGTVDVYTDGLTSNFLANSNQTTTKPVTDPSSKRWTWTAWVKRSGLDSAQKMFSSDSLDIAFGTDNKLTVGTTPFTYYYFSGTPSNLNDVLTNGTLYTGQNIPTTQNLVMVHTGGEVRSGPAFLTTGGFHFGLQDGRPGGYYTENGTRLGGTGTYNDANWADMLFTTRDQQSNYDKDYAIYTDSEVSYVLMGNYNGTSAQPAQPGIGGLITTETVADASVWMHVLVSCDTVSGEGYKLYVNGDQITSFDVEIQPALNSTVGINATGIQEFLGKELSGYLADLQFVDGQALTPSDFLSTSEAREGQLVPTRYAGWYGTRGYRLPVYGQTFESSAITNVENTSVAQNLVTGGTWELLDGTATNLAGGNPMTSWPVVFDSDIASYAYFNYGAVSSLVSTYRYTFAEPIPFTTLKAHVGSYSANPIYWISFNGGTPLRGGADINTQLIDYTDAVNGDTELRTLEIGTDGPNYCVISGIEIDGVLLREEYSSGSVLLTLTDKENLDKYAVGDSIVQSGESSALVDAFSTTLYTGNEVDNRQIETGIDNTGKSLVWIKNRSQVQEHFLSSNILEGKYLSSNLTDGLSGSAYDFFKSFDENGVTISNAGQVNKSGSSQVLWNFRALPQFFDIQTYVGTGDDQGQPHNLSSVPGCMILKVTGSSTDWYVYHKELGTGSYLQLNSSNPTGTQATSFPITPTQSLFYPGALLSASGYEYVAYLFADTPGLIKCDTYTGNNSTNGPVIDCGFAPAFVLIKGATNGGDWTIYDTARGNNKYLTPNKTDEEQTAPSKNADLTSSGFEIKGNDNAINASGITYIYVAIAENAMASATVTPSGIVSAVDAPTATVTVDPIISGWTVGETTSVSDKYITDTNDQNSLSWSKTNIDASDCGVDTPNNYGDENGLGEEVRGNYATLNPLDMSGESATLNGNLGFVGGAGYATIRSTLPITTKTYWETTVPDATNVLYYITGMIPDDVTLLADGSSRMGFSAVYGKSVSVYPANYNMWYNATTSISFADTMVAGDIIGHAYDPITGEYSAYLNGTFLGTLTADPSQTYYPAMQNADISHVCAVNFGSTEFAYPAPIGYKTLNTTNMETPLIPVGNTQMDVVTYTGSGQQPPTGLETSIGGLSFSPDLVWIKCAGVSTPHAIYDTVRGPGNRLSTNDTSAEFYDVNSLTGFTSDGFTAGDDALYGYTNLESYGEYVAWCWNAGDSTVLNTSGTVASQVRANPLAGFSVVTATLGTNDQIGHGLGVTPSMVFAKSVSNTSNWYVQMPDAMTAGQTLYLNTTAPVTSDNIWWGLPTSSTVKFNSTNAVTAPSDWVFYCWSEVPGFSKFGKVGSSQGERYVNTGFKPRWVMFKHATDATNWFIFDTERNPENPMVLGLNPNRSNPQETNNPADNVEFYNNGFKLWNAGSFDSDYFYAAFAETPTQFLPQ